MSVTEQGVYVESTRWGVAYGWVNASTGASWQKLRGQRQRRKVGGRGSQRPQRRREPQQTERERMNSPTRLSQQECDERLAAIFGGEGAIAVSISEPPEVRYKRNSKHFAGQGVIHIYANRAATKPPHPLGLYRPPGGSYDGGGEYEEEYYDKKSKRWYGTGNHSNEFRWKYTGGLLIKFFHVGGTSGGAEGGHNLGTFIDPPNSAGSIRIGNIGGVGGQDAYYFHSHIEFRVNGERTDPRSIFCGW